MMDILLPCQKRTIDWWKALVIEEELVDRSILIVDDFLRASDKAVIAIPCGKFRRSGSISLINGEAVSELFWMLQMRPFGFPNLRYDRKFSNVNGPLADIAWGDDLTALWDARKINGVHNAEAHRALGRAFGYKEEKIWALYPEGWPNVPGGPPPMPEIPPDTLGI